MDSVLDELVRYTLAAFLCSVVCVVDDNLTLFVEEVHDELLASVRDLLAQSHGLRALLSWPVTPMNVLIIGRNCMRVIYQA